MGGRKRKHEGNEEEQTHNEDKRTRRSKYRSSVAAAPSTERRNDVVTSTDTHASPHGLMRAGESAASSSRFTRQHTTAPTSEMRLSAEIEHFTPSSGPLARVAARQQHDIVAAVIQAPVSPQPLVNAVGDHVAQATPWTTPATSVAVNAASLASTDSEDWTKADEEFEEGLSLAHGDNEALTEANPDDESSTSKDGGQGENGTLETRTSRRRDQVRGEWLDGQQESYTNLLSPRTFVARAESFTSLFEDVDGILRGSGAQSHSSVSSSALVDDDEVDGQDRVERQ